jgi:ABC-type multidrug transport system fused ATPase/permease subunit
LKVDTQKISLSFLLVRLWHNFSSRRKNQLILLVGLMLISGFAEVISLGAILPFLGILAAPDTVFNHPVVAKLAPTFGITAPDQLILPFTLVFIVAALTAGSFRVLLLWVNTRLAFASGRDLSVEVYRRTLCQSYQIHVTRNSSEIISSLITKVKSVVFEVLLPLLTMVSSLVLLTFITITLVYINPIIALAAILVLCPSYGLIAWLVHQRLERNGKVMAYESNQVVKALQEGLGGIREVLLDNLQSVYCEIYRKADEPLRWAQGNNHFIAGSPRFIMEALGMIFIGALAYSLSQDSGGIIQALPMLGALVFGAQRLLPALQITYSCWAVITGSRAALSEILEILDQPLREEALQPAPKPLSFQKNLCFKNIRFRYIADSSWVLDDISFTIPKGSRVGFVGSTGSGKSTLLDIVMGLLIPDEGEVRVDDQVLNEDRIRAWQRIIAHVPQSVYMADTSLAENIAFGVPPENIDMDRVQYAARKAQIVDFIERQPDKYETFVGERGILLSGGQCQRIGIARALYKHASVLVFDEATSALDNKTENAVVRAIEEQDSNLTILIVAHRLTTVRHCDFIVELQHGRVVAKGKYDDLVECSPSFREMVKAAK